ncbi:4751_t:CDS:2 [Paraglomus brasilianum]|uniref:4751_t:CDS:1 n=1 Tax=Paraglomus brasilianum TaxID=144538 RepID=A0A9N8W4K9_9GLOM|nr:4751_t:CDS:2 [Paraglomus brasilianum]
MAPTVGIQEIQPEQNPTAKLTLLYNKHQQVDTQEEKALPLRR